VDQGVGVPMAQHPLVDSRVDGRIVRHRSRIDAAIRRFAPDGPFGPRRGRLGRAGNGREVTPEVTQHVRRCVLTLARMKRARGPALALGLEEEPDFTRRHRDHEPARRGGQQRFGAVVEAARQLDEPVAGKGRLADQKMLRFPIAGIPLDECLAHPEPGRLPDDRVRDARGRGIAPAGGARLEHRPRDVPLEEMDTPPGANGEVHELVNEEALARAGQPRDCPRACHGGER